MSTLAKLRDRFTTAGLTLALLFCACLAHAQAQFPSLDSAYPWDATYVPPGQASDIEAALQKSRAVRLGSGEYRGTLTIRSGQRVYGVPSTHVHRIHVAPGTQGAVVWLATPHLAFEPGTAVSRNNFIYGASNITISAVALDGNVFMGNGDIDIDLSAGGYVRNCRFIRTVQQSTRDLQFKGNNKTPSYNNVFLIFNPLCPKQAPMYLEDLQDVTFVGVDAELWLSKGKGAMFHTGKMGTLRIFGAQGGENTKAGSRDGHDYQPLPILDTAAEEVLVYSLWPHCPDVSPNYILRDGNKRSFLAGSNRYTRSIPESNIFDLNVFENGSSGKDVFRQVGVTPDDLKAMLVPEDREGVPWEAPVYQAIPDPAGSDWKKNLKDAPDHTEALQKRIDTEGVVLLEPGTYYISKPLLISNRRGIVGAGMDRTVLIAKNPELCMFRHDHRRKQESTSVTLANLTLQGGAVGLELRDEDIGLFITQSYVSHVQFRDMTRAGIHSNMATAVDVQALDNNTFTRCIFYRCPSGVLQTPNTKSNAGFLDKNFWYECQFVECGYGLNMVANRANNLNSCVNTLFKDCQTSALLQRSSHTTTFANCDFINNAGAPVLDSNSSIKIVSCRFKAGRSATSLLPSDCLVEGTTFEAAGASRGAVIANPRKTYFFNCESDMPMGSLRDAMLFNNRFKADAAYSQLGVLVVDGKASTLVPGATNPSPQMLFGADFSGETKAETKTAERSSSTSRSKTRKAPQSIRPADDVVASFDARLLARLQAATSKGIEVPFTLTSMKATGVVTALDDQGNMRLHSASPRMDLQLAFTRLSETERSSLAQGLVSVGDTEAHPLVAFYALCTKDRQLAQDHLLASGKDTAAEIQALFSEGTPGAGDTVNDN